MLSALPPDGEGSPAVFRHDDFTHELVETIGPERISGQWWESHNKTRDYFDVKDVAGNRFWIFRVPESGKWFLQGKWG